MLAKLLEEEGGKNRENEAVRIWALYEHNDLPLGNIITYLYIYIYHFIATIERFSKIYLYNSF